MREGADDTSVLTHVKMILTKPEMILGYCRFHVHAAWGFINIFKVRGPLRLLDGKPGLVPDLVQGIQV